jgi:hypothetical protein
MTTRSTQAASDVAALLRARNALIWIVTREEARVELNLIEAARSAGYLPCTWDVTQGLRTIDGRSIGNETQQVESALSYIDQQSKPQDADARAGATSRRAVTIMRDLTPWISDLPGAAPCRQLRNLARSLPTVPQFSAQAIIVLSTSANMPEALASHATVIDWPLPDRSEITATLRAAINGLPETMRAAALPEGAEDAAVDAALGLTDDEAAACYAKSLVQTKRIDAAAIAQEKKRVIARERVLEWYDPLPGGIDAVGGLDVLKGWLSQRRNAYSPEAREYGLPSPKGMLLVGPPGTGKSLTAKAVATAWGVPLLKLDLGALKSKFVGDSEANLRKALRVAESVGRCVVWVDEIEKALAGAVNGGADGGVSADALGSLLSWMQERSGEAFVVATSNDADALPPELLRKGRFDELWFVDLPNASERLQILRAALRSYKRDPDKFDLGSVAFEQCNGFTGSEIAAIVPDALFAAFNDDQREIEARDIANAARAVVPLSKTAELKINKLRDWAQSRARFANSPDELEPVAQRANIRAIDL